MAARKRAKSKRARRTGIGVCIVCGESHGSNPKLSAHYKKAHTKREVQEARAERHARHEAMRQRRKRNGRKRKAAPKPKRRTIKLKAKKAVEAFPALFPAPTRPQFCAYCGQSLAKAEWNV